MKIKVSDQFVYAVSPCNIRQWCEELIRYKDVIYIPENSKEHADIGINVLEGVDFSIYIDLSDPQSLVHSLPVDELVQEHWKNLLQISYIAPSVAFANSIEPGIPYYKKYDVYTSMISYTPQKKYMQPYMKDTEIIPLFHSLPEKQFYFGTEEKIMDIFFSGAINPQWYPFRNIMHQKLQFETGITSSFSGICGNSQKQRILQTYSDRQEQINAYDEQMLVFANKIRASKIFILDGSIFNIPVKKYFEGMSCGALVLAPLPIDADLLGFEDGLNMVVIDETNFMEKLRYYLEHEKERNHIVENAYQLYQERYTCRKSVEIFMKKINQIRNEREKRD